jgi:chromosome partitioning protein
MPRVKVYAVINQKGGVGKTTTVANLGAVIASRGHEVCLIDLDPQGHLTLHFGIDVPERAKTIYDVLIDEAKLDSVAIRVAPRLRVVPSVIDLAGAEVELVGTVGRERILRDRISASPPDCEFALIDCPPSLGLLTLNALAGTDEVLIPLQAHFLALQGLGKLLETISLVRKRINPDLRVAGIIFCMYETTTRLAGEVAADLEEFISSARGRGLPWSDARIFDRRIRRNIKLAECPSHGKTIFDYDAHSIGAQDYLALAEEFLTSVLRSDEPSHEGIPLTAQPVRSPSLPEPPGDSDRESPRGGESPTPKVETEDQCLPETIAPPPAPPQHRESRTKGSSFVPETTDTQ